MPLTEPSASFGAEEAPCGEASDVTSGNTQVEQASQIDATTCCVMAAIALRRAGRGMTVSEALSHSDAADKTTKKAVSTRCEHRRR